VRLGVVVKPISTGTSPDGEKKKWSYSARRIMARDSAVHRIYVYAFIIYNRTLLSREELDTAQKNLCWWGLAGGLGS
jgi:hypothetical protein